MKRSTMFVTCSAVILSIMAVSTAFALAQKKTVKACQEEWQVNKAANQANKITEKAYVEKCRAEGGTAQSTSAPAAAPAPKASTSAPPVATKQKDARQAEYARERACGKDWKADKAAGKVAVGMKWPQYWSECDKRKKAMGM